jgi:hypothetical protein
MSKCKQIEVVPATVKEIMRSATFRRGVSDVRAGRKPRFDEEAEGPEPWWYEYGRQFGVLAPRDMPIVLKGRLNPAAVRFFNRHDEDIC